MRPNSPVAARVIQWSDSPVIFSPPKMRKGENKRLLSDGGRGVVLSFSMEGYSICNLKLGFKPFKLNFHSLLLERVFGGGRWSVN